MIPEPLNNLSDEDFIAVWKSTHFQCIANGCYREAHTNILVADLDRLLNIAWKATHPDLYTKIPGE